MSSQSSKRGCSHGYYTKKTTLTIAETYAAIYIFKLCQSCPILGRTRVHVSVDCARMLGFSWLDAEDPLTEDVLLSPGNANMTFDLRPTKDVLLWPGYANMAFDLRPTEDVLPWPGNANMAFDLRPTKDVLLWLGNANMAFDLRPTEDVLPWLGNANMAFDLVPTEDVLSWPGNANMAFNLRPTEDVLLFLSNENMAFDLVLDLQCLLRTFYIRRYLRDMHEDNYNGIVISL
ncbi:hypothetical protein Tco_0897465 [Tanacetum coccineum]